MPRLIQSTTNIKDNLTHEGAPQYSTISDPLIDLVFSKGSVVFADGYYQSQTDEIVSFKKALLAADEHEPGFSWKYGAWMRDPKGGKGNRVQGSIVAVMLSAVYAENPQVAKEYIVKCLKHRPDDLISFVVNWEALGYGDPFNIPVFVRDALAETLEQFDDYQLMKYSSIQMPRVVNRKENTPKTLRLVDVMGLCKNQLSERLQKVYTALHLSTRKAKDLSEWPFFNNQKNLFAGKELSLVNEVRPTITQVLSNFGNTKEVWEVMLNSGLVPDAAFLYNIRNMARAGMTPDEISNHISNRKFHGMWPHQMYSGYRALMQGTNRGPKITKVINDLGDTKTERAFSREAMPEFATIFEKIFTKIALNTLPNYRSLGFGDVSASMTWAKAGGNLSKMTNMDIAQVLCAATSLTSGYAATFSDQAFIAKMTDEYTGPFDLVLRHPEMQKGMGGTQVYGSVVDTINFVKKYDVEPFKILYFFSDMQFHPVTQAGRGFYGSWNRQNRDKPLEAALSEWHQELNTEPPLVVLWNLASYDGSPLNSDYPGVAFISGYDTNTFKSLSEWVENGGRTVSRSKVTGKEETMSELLDFIRSY